MLIPVTESLDLTSTLLSGQAFRWRQDGPWFHGIIFGGIVKLREVTGGVELRCDPQAEGSIVPLLRDYLGLGTDLEQVYETLLDDERLRVTLWDHDILNEDDMIGLAVLNNEDIAEARDAQEIHSVWVGDQTEYQLLFIRVEAW